MVFVTHLFPMEPMLTTVFVRMDGEETVVKNVGHIGIAPIKMTLPASIPTSVSAMELCLTPMACVATFSLQMVIWDTDQSILKIKKVKP